MSAPSTHSAAIKPDDLVQLLEKTRADLAAATARARVIEASEQGLCTILAELVVARMQGRDEAVGEMLDLVITRRVVLVGANIEGLH
ncbi:MAG: hypothetical protein RR101_13640 [Burkholderiaceae bacterium]